MLATTEIRETRVYEGCFQKAAKFEQLAPET